MHNTDINWLHVELSSKCNAWCPACPRNENGMGLVPGLVEQDLSVDRYLEVLQQLPNLHAIQLCGNFGDPIAANNILDVIDISKKFAKKIQIHTNGSLRSTSWWHDFADVLSGVNHDVWFAIDGLAGVHEIYRQGTNYQKVVDNATAFINNGGYATWQFIPYAHNEHQIKDCIKTSQQLGFKKFKLVKLYRDKKTVKHYRTGESFELLPPKEFQHIIRMPRQNTIVNPTDCMHLSIPSVYLAADGQLSSCCYFALEKKNPTFDTVEELLYNNLNLTQTTCLENCGTKNEN